MNKEYTIEHARSLDEADELKKFRDEFYIEDSDIISLDGNSLGRPPKRSLKNLAYNAEHRWGKQLIRSWNEDWIELSERVGAKIAKLVGARPDEVIIADSTSVNLFKLAAAALLAHPERNTIVTDELNFPSDLYILQGLVQLFGKRHTIKVAKTNDGITIPESELAQIINSDTALVELSSTTFKSGFTYDLARVTKLAHEKGAYILWDVGH